MDPGDRLNEEQADRALRELFQHAGHHRASEELEDRILGRILHVHAAKPEPALLPKPVLLIGALLCLATFLVAGLEIDWLLTWHIPAVDLKPLLTSPWLIMTGASAIALLAINALLAKRTTALQQA